MIKELKLENIEISDGEKNIVAHTEGKILKVLFNPTEANSGVRLCIFTKEGELVMDVTQKGVYYPRANVSSEKMMSYSFSPSGDKKDYYYFNVGLLINITTNNPTFEGIVINRLIIIYEGEDNTFQNNILSKALQNITMQNQQKDIEELENGRR